uniref:C-type lectin domain-containing protein n=1 Tax=Sander lucioperca TaxID=283035 RepID=A0A8D0A7M2_SANLU
MDLTLTFTLTVISLFPLLQSLYIYAITGSFHVNTRLCHFCSADSQQQPVSNGRSKFPSERVALGVVSVLLAIVSDSNSFTSKLLLLQNHTNVNCWELHGGKCYYFSTDRLSWELSRNLCKEQHGDLVKIDSREEQQVCHTLKLREKMNEDEDKFWIGLTDSETEGTWLWADGSPLDTSLTFWSSGETEPEPEPDNWTGEDPDGEDCVRMGEKGRQCYFYTANVRKIKNKPCKHYNAMYLQYLM